MWSRDELKTLTWAQRYPQGSLTSSGDLWAAQKALGSVEQVEWRECASRDGLGQQALWRIQFIRRKGFSLHSYDVETPPCIFRRFTPDGRFLLALDRCGTDLLLFPYKRWACELKNGSNSKMEKCLSLSESGSASRPTVNDGRAGTFGDFFGDPLRISVINAYTVGVLARQRAPALHMEAHGWGEWTLSATYLRDLVLCTPNARFIILGAWSASQTPAREANSDAQVQPLLPSRNLSEQSNSRHHMMGEGQRHAEAPPDLGAPQPTERRVMDISSTAALPGCPLVPAVYLFLVDLEVQRVTDVFTLRDDMVNFDGQTGVQLFGTDLLLVTSLARQTVHLLRIRETACDRGYVEGAFQHLASFGPHCYPDDALLIAKQYRRERDFRRQGRRVFPFQLSDLQQAEDSCADSDSLGHDESMAFSSADRASTPAPTGHEEPTPDTTCSSEPVFTEGLNAMPEQRVPKRRRFRRHIDTGHDSERESSPFVMPCTTAAAVAGTAMAAAAFRMAYHALAKECFFTGIKQRLLAFLFRKHIQGNMHHYGRFASSFETLRVLIIQRAALVTEGQVLLRMVPAPHVLRAFTGSVATSLLHQPWYVSGISVAGLADSDLALVHAAEARTNATADTPSSWPDSVPPSAQVVDTRASKRRSDPMTELITQLRATLYVIYNYKNARIEAAFPPCSEEFLALCGHHPEWLGIHSGIPTHRIESSLDRLRERMQTRGSVYCPVCRRRHRPETTRQVGVLQKATAVSSDIMTNSGTTRDMHAWPMELLALFGKNETLEDVAKRGVHAPKASVFSSGIATTSSTPSAQMVSGCTRPGEFSESSPMVDIASLYNEPLLATFLLLPLPCQSHSASPWLNRRIFSYDESKLWSRDLLHPAVCNEYPTVRVFLRHKGTLSWRIYPAEEDSVPMQRLQVPQRTRDTETEGSELRPSLSATHVRVEEQELLATNNLRMISSPRNEDTAPRQSCRRRYAAYIFHPHDAFCLSILWSSRRPPVVNLHFGP